MIQPQSCSRPSRVPRLKLLSVRRRTASEPNAAEIEQQHVVIAAGLGNCDAEFAGYPPASWPNFCQVITSSSPPHESDVLPQVLWVSRCGLRDLEGASGFPQLKELYLAFNDVSDLRWSHDNDFHLLGLAATSWLSAGLVIVIVRQPCGRL